MRGVRRAVWPVLVTMVVAAVLFVGVFPTRTYLAQRAATGAAEEQLEVLRAESEALEERVRALQDADEVERLAREEYNLVRPGEEAYGILPPPGEEGAGSATPPEDAGDGDDDRNVLERAWDGVTGWF
jgi:cell division protein FtsB